MGRRAMVAVVVLAALVTGVSACSEPEPEATTAETTTTARPAAGCETDDLLACARRSTIGDLVPDEPTKADGEPIVLGMVNQENTAAGSFPELSQAVQAGIEFVNEELGGVDGRPLELQVCNTKFSTEGSTACAQQFVEAKVPAVLGGIDVFGTAIETLDDNGVPYIGGIPVSAPSVERRNSFQWSGGSWGAAVAFADYAIREVKAKKVAIVYGEFGSITQSAEYAEKVLDDAGVAVQLVPYPILSTDISSPLGAALSGDPDAIVVLAADTGCKPAFQGIEASGTDAQIFYVGACAAPTILADVDTSATDGGIFNVEGPIDRADPAPDFTLYSAIIERYGDGLDPVGAGTVSFRSFMNLYAVLRELGADGIGPKAIIDSLSSKVDEPSFMGHPYTCDGKQFDGLPAMCSPQQILAVMKDRNLTQVGDWVDVGAIYAG
ncbi:MAG: ABC transporter substrate-binding protein [Actinobacteria bacterium]|nr:ABC transporter substrate-binding protein [Actinomycetota bacterium]